MKGWKSACKRDRLRHRIPHAAVEFAAGGFFAHAAPLLEEKWNIGRYALVTNVAQPRRIHWPRDGDGLDADDNPTNCIEVYVVQDLE